MVDGSATPISPDGAWPPQLSPTPSVRLPDNAGVATDLALNEVEAGIFELRLPIPFEDGQVNVFLFTDGDVADLLDCGMNAEESLEAIREALAHIGARRLRRLVVTHIHPDHYGAAGVLAGRGKA